MQCGGCTTKNDQYPLAILEKTERHPCYSQDAHHKYARMHLPVAPKCNIGCNYCNRKFDCVNESRPGVTSEILTPASAQQKFELVKEKIVNLSVVGIAGPGDALANWEETKKSIQLIKQSDPNVIFCLSTNGLMLPHYVEEILDLGINHVTVTVNCIDPAIGSRIYKYINYLGLKHKGERAAQILLDNQIKGIERLTHSGVLVKINIVMIKDINDKHIPEVVKKMKELNVFVTNIMPLIPAPGSAFEHYPQTSAVELNKMRNVCELDMKQMRHCKQCRADAIGMLTHDRSSEFRDAVGNKQPTEAVKAVNHYKIAVATKYGILVDQHFGYAIEFQIYESDGINHKIVEKRAVNKYCSGPEECGLNKTRKENIVEALADCDAVLSLRIGYQAKQRLLKGNILPVEYCDTISQGLEYTIEQLTAARLSKEAI